MTSNLVRTSIGAWGSLVLALANVAQAQVPNTYRFDFGPDPQANVQATFTAINMPAGLIAKAYLIPSGQLTLSTSSGNPGVDDTMVRLNGIDRGVPPAPANGGAFTFSDLLRDFVSATNTANSLPVLTMVVDGFSPNTRYQATFWSYDAAAPAMNDEKSEWFINGKSFMNYSYNTSLPPRSNTDIRVSFSTTFDIGFADADRRVVFSGKYVSGPQVSVVLNGVEFIPIAAIPEPAEWQIVGCALPLLGWALYRRRARQPATAGG